jgi:hypothetical protein
VTFFDISRISDRQADPIAFVLGTLQDGHAKSASHRPEHEQLAIALSGLERHFDAPRLGWFGETVKRANLATAPVAVSDDYWSALSSISAIVPYRAFCKMSGVHADGSSRHLYSRIVRQEKFPRIAVWSKGATQEAMVSAQRCDAAISLTGRGIFKAAAIGLNSQNSLEIKPEFNKPLTASELAYAGYQMRLIQDLPNASSYQLMIATNFLD